MKKLKVIFTAILSLIFVLSVFAQGEHPTNKTVSNTIVDVAVSNKDFSTLVTTLKAADLVSALQGNGPFTVFAPTNAAFSKIDSKVLSSLLEEGNKTKLANILTYHVIANKLVATDVISALDKGNGSVVLTALNGEAITVMQKDEKIWLRDSNDNYSEITATDIMADNGVIHVISSVVMPNSD